MAQRAHPLLGNEPSMRAMSALVAESLLKLRSCLNGEDAKPKVVLHAFDWLQAEAWGAADALLKDGPSAAAVVTLGAPPASVAKFRVDSGGLYVVVFPSEATKIKAFCETLAWIDLKDPYALYIGVLPGIWMFYRHSLVTKSYLKTCSSTHEEIISPMAMRFAVLSITFLFKPQDLFSTLSFTRFERAAIITQRSPLYRIIVHATHQNRYLGSFCQPGGINSIDDYKKWVWKYRVLYMSFSTSQFISQSWKTKEGQLVMDGPDVVMTRTLLHFATNWINRGYREIVSGHGNKTSDGPFKKLLERTTHIFSMALPYDLDLLDVVEYATPVDQNDVCLAVRKAERMPFALVLVLPYQPYTWLCVGVTLLLAVLLWPLVAPGDLAAKPRTTLLLADRFGRSFTDTFGTFITGGSYRKVTSQSEKIFLGFLLVFNVVMINAYTGQIMSFLSTPKYYPDIRSINEASKTIKRIYSTEYVDNLLPSEYLPEHFKILKSRFSILRGTNETGHLIEADEFTKALHRVSRTPGEGLVIGTNTFEYFSLLAENMEDDQKYLYSVPECIISPNFIAASVVKGDGFYEVLNSFFSSLVEGGFFIHWKALQRNHMFANGVIVFPTASSEVPQKLNLNQLVAPFMLLGMGLAMAGLLLALQLARWRASRGKEQRRRLRHPPAGRGDWAGTVEAIRGRGQLVVRRRQSINN